MTTVAAAQPIINIRPQKLWQVVNFRELWQARELLTLLIKRDIKTRYKQTLLGPLWIVIMPILSSGIFSLVFGVLAGMSSGDVPLPIYIYTGMLLWNLFSKSMTSAASSLHSNQAIITKVYFPRSILPLAMATGNLIDFALGSLVLILLIIGAGITPGWGFVLAPLFVAYALIAGVAMGLWLSALSIRFRDVRYAAGFFAQILMWTTPVVYVATPVFDNASIPDAIRPIFEFLYQMNPIYAMVEGIRWSVLGYENVRFDTAPITAGAVLTLAVLAGAMFVFRQAEDTVADIV